MIIDLNKPVLNLDGEPIENSNLGRILANALANSPKGDALKFWEMAVKLHKYEPIDLDMSDQIMLSSFIKSNEHLSNIIKVQLLFSFEIKK